MRDGKVQNLIRKYVTDCMWLTAFDILRMLEQVDEDIDPVVVSITLIRLARREELERRKKRGVGFRANAIVTQYRKAVA
jgi:hypothetical protein